MKAFCINFIMNNQELVSEFVHVIDERDLRLKLAEEFIERDQIKMFE